MIRRRLRREPSVAVGELVLTPIVKQESGAGTTASGCWIVAAKRPVAIMVTDRVGRRFVRL
jgi:hypothetical protein